MIFSAIKTYAYFVRKKCIQSPKSFILKVQTSDVAQNVLKCLQNRILYIFYYVYIEVYILLTSLNQTFYCVDEKLFCILMHFVSFCWQHFSDHFFDFFDFEHCVLNNCNFDHLLWIIHYFKMNMFVKIDVLFRPKKNPHYLPHTLILKFYGGWPILHISPINTPLWYCVVMSNIDNVLWVNA